MTCSVCSVCNAAITDQRRTRYCSQECSHALPRRHRPPPRHCTGGHCDGSATLDRHKIYCAICATIKARACRSRRRLAEYHANHEASKKYARDARRLSRKRNPEHASATSWWQSCINRYGKTLTVELRDLLLARREITRSIYDTSRATTQRRAPSQ